MKTVARLWAAIACTPPPRRLRTPHGDGDDAQAPRRGTDRGEEGGRLASGVRDLEVGRDHVRQRLHPGAGPGPEKGTEGVDPVPRMREPSWAKANPNWKALGQKGDMVTTADGSSTYKFRRKILVV